MQGEKTLWVYGNNHRCIKCQNVYIGHGSHQLPDKVSGDKSQFLDGVHSLTVKGIKATCLGSKLCKNVSICQTNNQYHPLYIGSNI